MAGGAELITESQNVRGWKGPLWVTQSNPLPKQGHPEQVAQHRVQAGLEYLQRRRLHSLPGQPGPEFCHPQREEVLPGPYLAPSIPPSPVSSLASGVCPVAGVPGALSLPSPCAGGSCRAALSLPAAATCGLVMGTAGERGRGTGG